MRKVTYLIAGFAFLLGTVTLSWICDPIAMLLMAGVCLIAAGES